MKKLFSSFIIAAVLLTGLSLFAPVYAASDGGVYVVLRCTVTLSVSLTGSPTSFILGDVSPGTTVYSAYGVTLRNDSIGAICSWDLNIDNSSLGDWTLDDKPGLNKLAIYGVFQKNQNNSNFDIVQDTFSITPKQYMFNGAFACGDYAAEGYNGKESRILPYLPYAAESERKLWIKVLTPLAVNSVIDKNILIVITAKMAN